MQTTQTFPLQNELPGGAATPATQALHPVGQAFILGGRAIFTLVGRASRFTFKVTRKDPEPGSRFTAPTYFVALLTGANNETDYSYLGILDAATGAVKLTKGSRMTVDAPAVKAIQWAMPKLWAGTLPAGVQVHHEGRCGRCGRLLTVPESVISGFGPDCIGKVGGAAPTLPLAGPDPSKDDAAAVYNRAFADALGGEDLGNLMELANFYGESDQVELAREIDERIAAARRAADLAVTKWGVQ